MISSHPGVHTCNRKRDRIRREMYAYVTFHYRPGIAPAIGTEKLHTSDQIQEEAIKVLKNICPNANYSLPGQEHLTLDEVIKSVKAHSCYTVNSSVTSQNYVHSSESSHRYLHTYNWKSIKFGRHHRAKRASGSGSAAHAEHTFLEHLTHIFHLGSLVILSVLVFETFLKIFAMGTKFLNHRLEVFDSFVVTVSWILDLAFYEGIWAKPGSEAATILIVILPWRVIRIVNSFVLVIKEKDMVILKVVKQQYRRLMKKQKELNNKLEQYRVELRQLQGLCRKKGATEMEISACAPMGRKRISSVSSGMSSFASLAMIGAIASQPDLTRDSSSSEEEDEDLPSPTPSQIKHAQGMLRSISTDSGLSSFSDTVTFSLSPDPVGNSNSVFVYDNSLPEFNANFQGDSTRL